MKLWSLLFVVPVFFLSACTTGLGGFANGPNLGATPGGVQDMGFARELVANGQVPPAEAFVVEGMFSEHDLPLAGAPCERLLCLRSGLGVTPTLEEASAGWLQIGLSSSLDLESFTRKDLSVIFVVDISGSMTWEYQTPYNEYQTPLGVSKLMMEAIVPNLTEHDEVAIVSYGRRAETELSFTNNYNTALTKIRGLQSEGSTNMEAGLQRAYRLAAEAKNNDVRLMLFTDVQPNVGATSATEFQQLVEEGAASGAGLTVYGVGVGLGPGVFDAMSKVRGGNAFSLFGSRDVNQLMENDWPFLATPIAYDLSIDVTANTGTEVAKGYGFPTSGQEARLEASTVFLSKRRGALLIRFRFADDIARDNFALLSNISYETPEGEQLSASLVNDYDGTALVDGVYVEQLSVAKTVALALLVEAMHQAAEVYAVDQLAAVEHMSLAVSAFRDAAEQIDDEALVTEVSFAADLLALMEAGAPQGTLYAQ